MISITVDLNRCSLDIVQIILRGVSTKLQTPMATVVEVDQDPLESNPVSLPWVIGKGCELVDCKQDISTSNLGNVAERSKKLAIWDFLHVLVFL